MADLNFMSGLAGIVEGIDKGIEQRRSAKLQERQLELEARKLDIQEKQVMNKDELNESRLGLLIAQTEKTLAGVQLTQSQMELNKTKNFQDYQKGLNDQINGLNTQMTKMIDADPYYQRVKKKWDASENPEQDLKPEEIKSYKDMQDRMKPFQEGIKQIEKARNGMYDSGQPQSTATIRFDNQQYDFPEKTIERLGIPKDFLPKAGGNFHRTLFQVVAIDNVNDLDNFAKTIQSNDFNNNTEKEHFKSALLKQRSFLSRKTGDGDNKVPGLSDLKDFSGGTPSNKILDFLTNAGSGVYDSGGKKLNFKFDPTASEWAGIKKNKQAGE